MRLIQVTTAASLAFGLGACVEEYEAESPPTAGVEDSEESESPQTVAPQAGRERPMNAQDWKQVGAPIWEVVSVSEGRVRMMPDHPAAERPVQPPPRTQGMEISVDEFELRSGSVPSPGMRVELIDVGEGGAPRQIRVIDSE